MKFCKDCKHFKSPPTPIKGHYDWNEPSRCLLSPMFELIHGTETLRACLHERMPPPHSSHPEYDYIMHDKRCGEEGRNFEPKEAGLTKVGLCPTESASATPNQTVVDPSQAG